MDTTSRISLQTAKTIESTQITRHPVYYFSDGSVVLIVENTSFRIHQSILSRHSDFFATMFSLPQPAQVENVDGCPTVPLSGDSVNDFVDVMKALYDTFHFDNLKPTDDLDVVLKFVSGILRISTKYNMHILRKKCIGIIQCKFPSTLAACDEVLAKQYLYFPAAIVCAIPLARENNVPEILPWAYYLCTHMTTDDLMKDTVLDWRDKALCLAGKEQLWNAQKTKTHTVLFEFTRSPQCSASCHPILPSLGWRDTETLRLSPHPLEEYSGWTSLKLCPSCLSHMTSQHRSGREQVWKMLPEIFQLGSWESIQKNQNCSD